MNEKNTTTSKHSEADHQADMSAIIIQNRNQKIIARSSIGLVVVTAILAIVTGLYTYYAWKQVRYAEKQVEFTRDALKANRTQFANTLGEMRKQTQIAASNAELATRQISLIEDQTRSNLEALRMEQRAWLGYTSYAVQSRAAATSEWDDRPPKQGEVFRVKFGLHNAGMTPAIKVRPMEMQPLMVLKGHVPNAPTRWDPSSIQHTVFPGDKGLSHNAAFSMEDLPFSLYPIDNESYEAFFWTRVEYCDISGRRHWTQAGIGHRFGSRDFSIRSSDVSPGPGEEGHPDCQSQGENPD